MSGFSPRLQTVFSESWLFAFLSIPICLALFYIDEGRYSLEGLLRTSNLIGLLGYGLSFTLGAGLVNAFFVQIGIEKSARNFLAILIGFPIGFFIAMFLFLSLDLLFS